MLDIFSSWLPILDYMDEQFDRYLNEEVSINRKKVIPDTRVHCCLYFIPPTGHRSVRVLYKNVCHVCRRNLTVEDE